MCEKTRRTGAPHREVLKPTSHVAVQHVARLEAYERHVSPVSQVTRLDTVPPRATLTGGVRTLSGGCLARDSSQVVRFCPLNAHRLAAVAVLPAGSAYNAS